MSSASNALVRKSKSLSGASHEEWLAYVQDVQMKQITPTQRAAIMEKVASRQVVAKKAKASRNVELRSKNAMYCQLQCSKALASGVVAPQAPQLPPQASASAGGLAFLSDFFGVSAARAPASAPEAPVAQEVLARESMNSMEQMDRAWEGALRRHDADEAGRDNSDMDLAEEVAEATFAVDDGDIDAVLADLVKEPATDDARAAKFTVFEKFSERVGTIRTALEDVAESASRDLPNAAKNEMRREMKALDTAELCGIHDLSRAWFVHDMMKQASKNCKTMEALSRGISAKLRLVAENTQDACPICLRKFVGAVEGQRPTDNGDEEERCEPKVLSCCHAVCTECWAHWAALRGAAATCPICRQQEFLEFVAADRL